MLCLLGYSEIEAEELLIFITFHATLGIAVLVNWKRKVTVGGFLEKPEGGHHFTSIFHRLELSDIATSNWIER